MKNQLPPVGVIDVGSASWGIAQFLANDVNDQK